MIIVKLMGGLGNQLFQYAFGRHLAIMHNVELKLDITALQSTGNNYTIRDLGLRNFNIKAGVASEMELQPFQKNKVAKIIDLFLLHLPIKKNKLYLREPGFRFFRKAMATPSDSYLDGYWQSEKYFKDIRSRLLEELTLSSVVSDKTTEAASRISATNSVSIHVRRGDYISVAQNQNIYEVCDVDYYLCAMEHIAAGTKEPAFYVFSDEPDWFRQNVKSTYPVEYITHNIGADSYQDLYLMSLCKHNIIANSSFSWWGAWLNSSKEKIVVAPKKWFKDKNKDTRDLIPKSWIKI